MEVLLQGFYCEGCLWFEDDIDLSSGKCMGCGCASGKHVPAVVVPAS